MHDKRHLCQSRIVVLALSSSATLVPGLETCHTEGTFSRKEGLTELTLPYIVASSCQKDRNYGITRSVFKKQNISAPGIEPGTYRSLFPLQSSALPTELSRV